MLKIKTKIKDYMPTVTKSFVTGFFVMVGLIGGYTIVKASYGYTYDGAGVSAGATLTADMWNWSLTNNKKLTIANGEGNQEGDLLFDELWTVERSSGRHHIQAGSHDGPVGSAEYSLPGKLYLNPWNGAGEVIIGGGDSSTHSLYVANGNFVTNNGENGIEILKNEKRVVLGSTNSNSNIEIYGNNGLDGNGTVYDRNIIYDAANGHIFRGGQGVDTKVYVNGELCLNNVCSRTLGGGSSLWQQSANNLFTVADMVGVGTANPQAKLHVNGDLRVDGRICLSGRCISSFDELVPAATCTYEGVSIGNGQQATFTRTRVNTDNTGPDVNGGVGMCGLHITQVQTYVKSCSNGSVSADQNVSAWTNQSAQIVGYNGWESCAAKNVGVPSNGGMGSVCASCRTAGISTYNITSTSASVGN